MCQDRSTRYWMPENVRDIAHAEVAEYSRTPDLELQNKSGGQRLNLYFRYSPVTLSHEVYRFCSPSKGWLSRVNPTITKFPHCQGQGQDQSDCFRPICSYLLLFSNLIDMHPHYPRKISMVLEYSVTPSSGLPSLAVTDNSGTTVSPDNSV